jgi:hypothetical protein
MPTGPAFFVDAAKGSDANDGSEKAPWKTLRASVARLRPGDTLCLRAGTWHEPLYVALRGTMEKPITIRAFRGERAVVDGGLPEFFLDPANAWEPVPAAEGGAEGEHRSRKAYPNLRDLVGAFGDSMVGLQTYWHLKDLRATNENFTTKGQRDPDKDPQKGDADTDPIWVGPGVFYDPASGRIHARLAHTHLPGVDNYQGETDPRKLPLVLAPFASVPLLVDQGEHLKFQDLVIRGGGYETVVLNRGTRVEFDRVTVHTGTYGMTVRNTVGLRFWASGLYGNLAGPWCWRAENGLRARPGRSTRDIARLTGHALWVQDTGREYSVYAMPYNDDWEIAYSEFYDCHDGLYLGGVDVDFHHNRVDNMQDDGIYLSPMYPRYGMGGAAIKIHENLFSRCLSTLAFGGPEPTEGTAFIWRNVFDLRGPVKYNRPEVGKEPPKPFLGRPLGSHGRAAWVAMNAYHNTFVMADPADPYMGWLGSIAPEHPRRLLNNLFVHLAPPTAARKGTPEPASVGEGNLVWTPANGSPQDALKLARVEADPAKPNDYSPRPGSPALNAGVPVPKDWPGAADPRDEGAPDAGALPAGAPMLKVGPSAAP